MKGFFGISAMVEGVPVRDRVDRGFSRVDSV